MGSPLPSSKSLASFFNRSVTLSDLEPDPKTTLEDLGNRRLRPTAEQAPDGTFEFDGQAWDARMYSKQGLGPKNRLNEFVRQTTLPTVAREKARRSRSGHLEGAKRGLLKKLDARRKPREAEQLDHSLRTIGHVPIAGEPPNLRKSALRLERRYKAAMAVVDGRDPHQQGVADTIDRIAAAAAAPSGGGDAAKDVAVDYLACCSNVEAAFAERSALTGAVNEQRGREDSGAAPDPASPGDADGVAAAVGLTCGMWREAREALSASIFEQKWASMTCAEVGSM